jgi:hypothetical protein
MHKTQSQDESSDDMTDPPSDREPGSGVGFDISTLQEDRVESLAVKVVDGVRAAG